MPHQFGPRTKLIHTSSEASHGQFYPHVFPIFQTSTFGFESVEELLQTRTGQKKHDFYSRGSNPNHRPLEERLCDLEEGEAAQVFDSGMSAVRVAIMSFVKAGKHIIAHSNLYGGTMSLLKELQDFGVETTFVDTKYSPNVVQAIRPETAVVFLESPSNPMLDICDFSEISAFVHTINKDIVIILDNTFATPYNQKPLTWEVDIVVHSLTKYLNGSGQYIAGAIVTSQRLMDKIWEKYHVLGGVLEAEAAFRIAYNMTSAEDRMRRHNSNAEAIAYHLKLRRVGLIDKVYYPGLFTHPNHKVASHLMTGFGGMVSFELVDPDGSKTRLFLNQLAKDCVNKEGVITLSVSLGTVDSLICCPAMSTHFEIPQEERLAQGITDNLIRLSVGTEDMEDIRYSLDRGFKAIS